MLCTWKSGANTELQSNEALNTIHQYIMMLFSNEIKALNSAYYVVEPIILCGTNKLMSVQSYNVIY